MRQVHGMFILNSPGDVVDERPRCSLFRSIRIVHPDQHPLHPGQPDGGTGNFSPTGRIAPAPQDTCCIGAAGCCTNTPATHADIRDGDLLHRQRCRRKCRPGTGNLRVRDPRSRSSGHIAWLIQRTGHLPQSGSVHNGASTTWHRRCSRRTRSVPPCLRIRRQQQRSAGSGSHRVQRCSPYRPAASVPRLPHTTAPRAPILPFPLLRSRNSIPRASASRSACSRVRISVLTCRATGASEKSLIP